MSNEYDKVAGTSTGMLTHGAGNDAQAIIDAATRAAAPRLVAPGEMLAQLVPDGARLVLSDTEHLLPNPRRKRGYYTAATVESFIAYVGHHEIREHTTIWVHPTSGQIVAVLNDHGESQAHWRDHKATLALEHTEEWQHWRKLDGQLIDQAAFADHVEIGLTEIAQPAAADMLELAQSFHATTSAVVRSAHRLHSGEVKVVYDENVDAKAGRSGDMDVPSEFVLALAPFVGEEPYRVKARLRYRLSSGTLKLGYSLDRPGIVIRDCLAAIAERLAGQFEDRVYLGSPPQ